MDKASTKKVVKGSADNNAILDSLFGGGNKLLARVPNSFAHYDGRIDEPQKFLDARFDFSDLQEWEL
jgi:hypothetical protein